MSPIVVLLVVYLAMSLASGDFYRISISVAFVANGMCSVVQNAQQYKFGGAQNGNFMVLALFISFIALVVLAAVFERKTFLPVLKQGSLYAAAEGLCNGATNLLVMVIIGVVATSVFFPVLSCCQMILIFIISAAEAFGPGRFQAVLQRYDLPPSDDAGDPAGTGLPRLQNQPQRSVS